MKLSTTKEIIHLHTKVRQVIDKYLVQDRLGEVFETPQFMYMLISHYLQNTQKKKDDLC